MPISKPKLSTIVPSQLPEFIRGDYTAFVAFIQAYYEFLRQNYDVDLLNARDLDNTLDSFIQYFKREFAINIPQTLIDDRILISRLKDYYLAKGTEGSFKIMLKILFGKDVEIDYPSRQVLRASDGRWNQDVSLFARVNAGTPDLVVGRMVDVITPSQTLKVQINKHQDVEIEVNRYRQISTDIFEFYIDRRFFGNVSIADRIRYADVFDATILPTTSKVTIQRPGKKFKAGELYEVINGSGVGSVLKVSTVDTNGSITSLDFVKYGVGYTTDFTATLLPLGGVSATTAGATGLSISGGSPAYGVGLADTTNGFFEQGYINRSDYNIPGTGETGGLAWDGSYAGEIVREFFVDNKYTILDPDEPAIVSIQLGALTKYPGYYTTNDGFLSDAIFIQDSYYYQAFSYVIKIDERLEKYKAVTKSLLHPSGMALFGEYDIRNEFDLATNLESMIKFLAISQQDNFLMTDSGTTYAFTKQADADSVTITHTNVWSLTKPLGSQIDYDGNTESSVVTPSDSLSSIEVGKALGSQADYDGNTESTTFSLTDNGVQSVDVTKALGSQTTYSGATESTSVTMTDNGIQTVDVTKSLGDQDLYGSGTETTSVSLSDTNNIFLTTTKYMDSAGSYPHYLNDETTLDNDTTTMTDSGNLWLNPYTDPYPTASSYFLNDGGDYTDGESAFTG